MKNSKSPLHVHALWTDERGTQEWYWAEVLKIRLTQKDSNPAGVLVAWLDEEKKRDKGHKTAFIPLYHLERELRLPGTEEGDDERGQDLEQEQTGTSQIKVRHVYK